jgi:hypothetical protein
MSLFNSNEEYKIKKINDQLAESTHYINVTTSGAKANDSTFDNYTVIQNAVNSAAATANKKGIIIPNGTYYISKPINVPSNVEIIGESHNAILICKVGMNPYDSPLSVKNVSDVTIKNLTIDGNKTNISGDIYTGVILLRVENSTKVIVDNVTFQNNNHGAIFYSTVTNFKVSNCNFENVDFCIASSDTNPTGDSNYIWIENNYFNGHNYSEPIIVSRANYVTVRNNTILNKPNSNGIQLMGVNKAVIDGNKIYNTSNAIFINRVTVNSVNYDNSNITITNNDLELSTSSVYAKYVTGLEISGGNHFRKNQMYLYNSSDINIEGNRFSTVANGDYARIQIFNDVNNVNIANNVCNYFSANNLVILDKTSANISNIIIHDNQMINGGIDARQTATNVKIYNNYNNGVLYFPPMWYNTNYVVNSFPFVSIDKPIRGYSNIGDIFKSSTITGGYLGGICTTAGYNVTGLWGSGNKYIYENYLLSNGTVVLCTKTGLGTAEPLGITSANTFANPYIDNDVQYVYCGTQSVWKSWGTIGSVI